MKNLTLIALALGLALIFTKIASAQITINHQASPDDRLSTVFAFGELPIKLGSQLSQSEKFEVIRRAESDGMIKCNCLFRMLVQCLIRTAPFETSIRVDRWTNRQFAVASTKFQCLR